MTIPRSMAKPAGHPGRGNDGPSSHPKVTADHPAGLPFENNEANHSKSSSSKASSSSFLFVFVSKSSQISRASSSSSLPNSTAASKPRLTASQSSRSSSWCRRLLFTTFLFSRMMPNSCDDDSALSLSSEPLRALDSSCPSLTRNCLVRRWRTSILFSSA